jgi:hypothetical protein
MDSETRKRVSALLSNARDQQKTIGDLQISLEAAIAALKTVNPRFESEYERERLSPDRDDKRHVTERVLALIQSAIDQLKTE